MHVTLLDAGSGNLRSVHKALEHLGAQVTRTSDPALARQAEALVLPGVGAFGAFMDGLRARGLDAVVRDAVRQGVPTLGICVGMQALFERGFEMGEHAGLGLLPGEVVRFPEGAGVRVPHTGWNRLWARRPSEILAGLPEGAYAFFNHSYLCQPAESADVLAETVYGQRFASVVGRGSLFGVQFHPEKSQQVGLRILGNFLRLAGFTLFPAIDLRHGQVVRLKQGDPARQTTYSPDPAEAARRWMAQGARWLHVVNLDGAFGEADAANRAALAAILRVSTPRGVQVQFGGGLRSLDDIAAALGMGAARVVLGTAAIENPALVAEAVRRFGARRIAVGLDAREGRVQVRGWQADSGVRLEEAARRLCALGVQTFIVTDVARDGLGTGVNVELAARLRQAGARCIIASGGVRAPEDVQAARAAGLQGVVIGRALYEGAFTLQEGWGEDDRPRTTSPTPNPSP